jgi:hypothetical protein
VRTASVLLLLAALGLSLHRPVRSRKARRAA